LESRAVALPVSLSSPSKLSIERQLVDQLRRLIKHGALFPGARLPSSRMLADDLGCSRTPIVAAYDRLVAEGYLLSRPRSGLQVATRMAASPPARKVSRGEVIGLSQRGRELADTQQRLGLRSAQMPGHPSIEGFPFELWGNLCTRAWRRPTSALVWGDDPAGYLPLRQAIAAHLRMVRGMVCDAEQIIVTSGTRHGADLAARVLLDPGDQVAIEDPGWPAWQVLASHGATLRPVPMDDEGISVEGLARLAPSARMVAVTPSHQFPTGVAMSHRRRLDLLDRARKQQMWILENDFDSEFQYSGEPLSALRSLDEDRVIYLGTFSRSMFPSLRLGYMVLPRHLVETFLQARSTIDGFPPMMLQPVMAAFLEEGHLARHVRNMRRLYKARHASLVAALRRHFGDRIEIVPTCGGLTLTVMLRQGCDVALARDARACGLSAYPFSATAVETTPRPGLVLGLAELPEDHVDAMVARFAALSAPASAVGMSLPA
jgi:GntR family transcriptional regulator/MocR family aminotransferase